MLGGGICFETAAGLETVNSRHHDIEQDEVRLVPSGSLNSLKAIAGSDDPVAAGQQNLLEAQQVDRIVIDYQKREIFRLQCLNGSGHMSSSGWR